MIKVVADSSCDIITTDRINYKSVPVKIIGKKEYSDDENLDIRQMMDDLKRDKCKTSSACPNSQEYLDAFQDADEIFVFTVSKNLSGSYNAARLAIEECPDKKIALIDPLSAGPEVTLYIEKVIELNDQGYSFEQIRDALNDYLKHTCLVFTLENIDNFVNNGRVSPAVGKAIGLLGLRMVGRASEEGTFEVVNKVKGKKRVIKTMINKMIEDGYKGGKAIIHHAFSENMANDAKNAILEKFPHANVTVSQAAGLVSYYIEDKGFLIGFEI